MIKANKIIEILYKEREGFKFVSFQEKIINTKLKIIGVKVPVLRKLAKQIYKQNQIVEFNDVTDDFFECVVLEGFLIGFEKNQEKLKLKLNNFFKKMDNWAVVDMVCASLKYFKKELNKSDFEYFKSLLLSDDLFTVRFGLVCLLKFFSDKQFNDDVFDALKLVKCGEYYVDMAIAWLISEIIIKNVQNAEKIVKKVKLINNLNTFIVNKSVDKVCDSYRVNKSVKQKLRKMKLK